MTIRFVVHLQTVPFLVLKSVVNGRRAAALLNHVEQIRLSALPTTVVELAKTVKLANHISRLSAPFNTREYRGSRSTLSRLSGIIAWPLGPRTSTNSIR